MTASKEGKVGSIVIYNSLKYKSIKYNTAKEQILQVCQWAARDPGSPWHNINKWRLVDGDGLQQQNGNDCGAFVLLNALAIMQGWLQTMPISMEEVRKICAVIVARGIRELPVMDIRDPSPINDVDELQLIAVKPKAKLASPEPVEDVVTQPEPNIGAVLPCSEEQIVLNLFTERRQRFIFRKPLDMLRSSGLLNANMAH